MRPPFEAAPELAETDFSDRVLLRWVLDKLSEMTTAEFARGGDRTIRRRIARHLRLNPDDYSL